MARKHISVKKRVFLKLLRLILVVGIPVFLFAYIFSLQEIKVKGSTRNSEQEIKEHFLQTKLDYNTLLLYMKYKYFEEIEIPFVEKVDLKLSDFNSIDIRIYEKSVIGCVEFMREYLYFDKDGIVVETSPERLEDIPQIKGLKFDKIILHERLEVQREDLFNLILDLTQSIQLYDLDVDNITFNSRNEVTLKCADVKVLLGKKEFYDGALKELKNILSETGYSIYELDLTNYDKGYIFGKPKNTVN